MKIILVVSDTKQKNLVFVTDTLKALSLSEAVKAVQSGEIQFIHTVKSGAGTYLRTDPNISNKDNLDFISHSSYQLFNSIDDAKFLSGTGLWQYWNVYSRYLERLGLGNDEFIWIDGERRTTKEHVISILHEHREIIREAAKNLNVDSYLLGAIMIDEIARMAPFEEIRDVTVSYILNLNVSVGIAQIKLQTAKELIKSGYYNPNPADPKLATKRIGKVPLRHLYQYVKQPKHSIFFSAAKIRSLIDEWSTAIDLEKRPEIISTLYHLKHKKPNKNPKANKRGIQISNEFYKIAKGLLIDANE